MKKPTLSKVKSKCWDAFSIFIRTRDWDKHGRQYLEDKKAAPCITCSKVYPVEGKGTAQAGHFIPGRKNQFLFDEDQVNTQCYNCNCNLKGNWPAYYEVMVKTHGLKKVQAMINARHEVKIYKIYELEEMTEDYKQRAKDLNL